MIWLTGNVCHHFVSLCGHFVSLCSGAVGVSLLSFCDHFVFLCGHVGSFGVSGVDLCFFSVTFWR